MNMIDAVNREVEIAIAIAEKQYNLNNVRNQIPITVRINTRLTRALGRVLLKYVETNNVKTFTQCTLEISGRWLKMCPELIDTIRHEVAHYIDTVINNRISMHDVIWKRIAKRLGANPQATKPAPAEDLCKPLVDKKQQPKLSPFYCPKCAERFMLDAEAIKKNGTQYRHNVCGTTVIHEFHVKRIATGTLRMIGTKTAAFEALLETFFRQAQDQLSA